MTHDRDPNHPVIERPFEYEIVEFSYIRPLDGSEPYIDLGLVKGDTLRCLRFFDPRDIRITEGFPNSSGLAILDVSSRQMDRLGVRVINFEASDGCPEFWARDVVDLLAH
jgi:hypothetical protein